MPTPEQCTQLAVVSWVKMQHPEVAKYIVMINNDGKRTVGNHLLHIKMGLHQGASDLFIAYPVAKYHGLWVELKNDKWKAAYGPKAIKHLERQMDFIEKMKKIGYQAALAKGTDAAIKIIDDYVKSK